jgi:predicted transcriptional regulator
MSMPLGTTRTVLSKLVKKGLIEKRGAAKYGALTTREKEVPSTEKTS